MIRHGDSSRPTDQKSRVKAQSAHYARPARCGEVPSSAKPGDLTQTERGLDKGPELRQNQDQLSTEDSPMQLGLINSAWAQTGKDTAYGIRMTREIGFDCIDIFTDPLDIDIKERRLIK